MSKPAQRAIIKSGLTTLEELAIRLEIEGAQWHGIGLKALVTLRSILEEKGLSFSIKPIQGK